MVLGEKLLWPGAVPERILFVESGMASVVVVLEEGNSLEAAAVGFEGLIGAHVVLGGLPMPSVEVVGQVEGELFGIPTGAFEKLLLECPTLDRRVRRFQSVMLFMALQSSACAGQHPVESRLARWLLTVANRTGLDDFMLTQDFIAQMLGVQRSTVTIEARSLAISGLIEYRRGHVRILDRQGLEDSACECYFHIEEQYRQLR